MEPVLFRRSLLLAWAGWLALGSMACEKPLASETATAAKRPMSPDPSAIQTVVAPAHDSSEPSPELDEPDDKHPVSAGAFLQPARVPAGGTAKLVVQFKTAPRWHIYAPDSLPGTALPTTLTLKLPEGIEAVGDWVQPNARKGPDGTGRMLEGSFQFVRRIKVSNRPGRFGLTCDVNYQACDPFSCQPPRTLTLKASGEVVPGHQ
jgi:DsbC/DsbD-like thiol-disulfide interchange protein